MGKSREIHFWGVGVWKMANIFLRCFSSTLTNVCLFVSFYVVGVEFCEALNEINEIFGKNHFYFTKKRSYFLLCFVSFCILRSRFSFITYEITARFLLILILEVKLHNCFFFTRISSLLVAFSGLFRAFPGLFWPFLGAYWVL